MSDPSAFPDEASWQIANLAFLQGQMRRLLLLLERRVLWLRKHWEKPGAATCELASDQVISDAAADRLLVEDRIDDMQQFFRADSRAAAIGAQLDELGQTLEQQAAVMRDAGRPPALEVLCRLFGLNGFERDALMLCVAAEKDQAIARLCAYVQDDVHLRFATMTLAPQLFCDSDAIAHVARRCFVPDAVLRRCCLLWVAPFEQAPHGQRSIRVDDRILDYVCGIDRMDERALDVLQPVLPMVASAGQCRAVEQILAVLQAPDQRPRYAGVSLFGPPGSGRRAVARELCGRLNLDLYSLQARRMLGGTTERQALLRLLGREAVLSRFAIYIRLEDFDGAEAGLASEVLDRLPVFYIVASRTRPTTRRELLGKKLVALDTGARAELWREAMGAAGASLNGQSAAVAEHFPFGQEMIVRAVSAASARARMRDVAGEITEDDVWEACREQASWDLRQLAQQVEPAYTWDDIVLPADVLGPLHEIAAQVAQRAKVYRQWGFGARAGRGLGISALFAGVSGTGKTMAAEILARYLRLDLFRIDLAGVVSKYIGETEKNLKRIFDAAERCGAILFFDEADALFGKRTEVKDSHDRFANIEINYLLQRMENFAGLSILATNRKSDLDRAFLRRLRFLVDFPFPDSVQRMRIWHKSFPPGAPLEELDYDALARLEIAGGNIRNIALAAAFLAAQQDVPISMTLLMQAARREYAKMEIMMGEANAERSDRRPAWK